MAASLSATYMLHGESSMATVWGTGPAAVGKKTPYDDPATVDKTVEKSLKVSGRFESNPFAASSSQHLRNLGLMTQLDYIMHWNKGNLTGVDTNDIQWTFGIDWKL